MLATLLCRSQDLVELTWDYRQDTKYFNLYGDTNPVGAFATKINANPIDNVKLNLSTSGIPGRLVQAQNRVYFKFLPSVSLLPNTAVFYVKLEVILTATGLPEEPLANVPYLDVYPQGVNRPYEKDSRDLDQHLWGWDYDNNVWRKVAVDSQGRIKLAP